MSDIKNLTSTTITNDIDFYKELRERRGVKQIEHFTTPVLSHPTVAERARLRTSSHVWKYGDRLYKLAHQYYGDVRYWWVIAWYYGFPTEAEIATGDLLEVPLDISEALLVLGA